MSSPEQEHYFLHTLVGSHNRNFGHIMIDLGLEWPALKKMETFLGAQPESAEGVSAALGLDHREIMCTVSRVEPATTYHSPFGLVLSGAVRAYFDNDSGKMLQPDGTYSEGKLSFTNQTNLDHLLGEWYDDFEDPSRPAHFVWNEAILEKGSRVVGAFHDPRANNMRISVSDCPDFRAEYNQFLDKVERCGLALLEITAKYGLYAQ